MTRFFRSFAGQMAMALALALLVAQSINFILLWQLQERLRAARDDAFAARLVVAYNLVDRADSRINQRPRLRSRLERQARITEAPRAAQGAPDPVFLRRLKEALADAGREDAEVFAGIVNARAEGPTLLVTSLRLSNGQWLNIGQPAPPDRPPELLPLIVQTLLIYVILVSAILIAAQRLSQPLAHLRAAADGNLLDDQSAHVPLPPEGPEDVRAVTEAFNRMSVRLRKEFAEKDMMIGAIGHDLRTPLTALRLRVEQVGDTGLREKMVRSIEDMSLLLDDILGLARKGAAGMEATAFDGRALLADLVEGMEDDRIRMVSEDETPVTVTGYPSLLKRALQNLVGNALRYAGSAELEVVSHEGNAIFLCRDTGPGIPEDDVTRLVSPFERGEESRSRDTGGAGLGLAIAEVAAKAHGGMLTLRNREAGGLEARLDIPFSHGPGRPSASD